MNKPLKYLYIVGFILSFLLIATSIIGGKKSPCLEVEGDLILCAASDMAKVTRSGSIPFEVEAFDLSKGLISLDAARNETIAFQLFLKRKNKNTPASIGLNFEDFNHESDNNISAENNIKLFKAHYHWVEQGGYTWGPDSKVLPWPDYYPDALIPQTMICKNKSTQIFKSFPVPEKTTENQAVWVDIYIPKDQPQGDYKTRLIVTTGQHKKAIPINLKIWNVTLPDRPSLDAVGEIYNAYQQEGAGKSLTGDAWREMAHCYQQLAHKHRMVFIERRSFKPNEKPEQKWEDYNKVYAPIMTGELFSEENGYIGPGANTPATIWRTPWPQNYNVKVEAPLTEEKINSFTDLARDWQNNVENNNWDKTEFIAYIFDEVDGNTDEAKMPDVDEDYFAMAHQQMDRVQKAMDKGAGGKHIDLIWTSHADASIWQDNPEEDLSDIIRHWVPNGHAADPDFYAKRKAAGDQIWLYHSGHPAIGIHSINASGIEMRTWGVISVRYNFDGQLMWALNLSDDKEPYRYPSYRKKDDRFGNGMLVYPGNMLANIGEKSVPGPIPSMRLKAWRRGLQDAELIFLAREKGNREELVGMLEELIPNALADGKDNANWSDDPTEWIDFHREILERGSN